MEKNKNKLSNNKRKGTQRFVDVEFAKLLDEIKKTRIMIGKDDPNNIKADWRITLAMARHPNLRKPIMEDIINNDLQ